MRVSLPIVFSQFDSRWASILLGFNVDPAYNIYNYGCLDSDLATICRAFGFDETPATINEKLVALGADKGFQKGGGNYVWGAISKLHKEIKESLTNIGEVLLSDAQMGEIKSALDAGNPVMLQIDYNPQTVKNDTHYVIAVDYNPNDENDITVADPLGGGTVSLKKYLGWLVPNARRTIFQYVIYQGPKMDAVGCLLPNTKDNQKVFQDLVHGSSEWDKAVAATMAGGTDPKSAGADDLQRVVNGIKSTATAAQNDKVDTEKKLAAAETEIANRIDQLANKDAERQRTVSLLNAEIDALKKSQPDVEVLKGQYQGTIDDLEKQVRDLQRAGGQKDLDIAALQKEKEMLLKGIVPPSVLDKLFAYIRKLFGQKK